MIRTCKVEGCGGRYYALGYCCAHYRRVRKHGDPGGPDVRPWRGPDWPGYKAVHNWLTRERGPASDHWCWFCGRRRGADWSYLTWWTWSPETGEVFAGIEPPKDERVSTVSGGSVLRYSTSLDRYAPACRSCHKRWDLAVAETLADA